MGIYMKKLWAVIVIIVMAVSIVSGCISASAQNGQNTDVQDEAFVFNPKVSSVYLDEIFGETMVETWYNLVDAVLAGEDTFACPDQEIYDWVIGQFPDRCFPVLTQLIEPVYGGAVENGTARFNYTASREELEAKMTEFEELVEDILNKTMKKDYSDLEKVLSLYRYFYSTYEYDYDTAEKMEDEYVDYLYSYRFLTEGTGVCQEISTAYSYLLLQAGVNATIMMSDSRLQDLNHQWSYVRINGNNYHIDPTYAMNAYSSLEYFMMTDEKRSEEFPPEDYVIASTYTQDHECPVYVADDDTFSPLWDVSLEEFDHEAHIIYGWIHDDDGNAERVEFDYAGY